MIRRGCERPFFLRIGSIIRGRRIRQEGGGHLVGEAAEVVVDLDLDASEAGGVPGQLIAPLSLLNIDLMGQLRRDVVQGDNKGAGLGSGVDLHRRLVRAAGREEMRLCYRDPEAITTFRKSTLRELYGHDRCGRGAKAGSGEFTTADAALRQSVAATQAQADAELADPKLPTPCQKVLTSLQEHWSGLTRFLDDPQIPLDHNASERRVRGPAVARKNYCGSGA